ncbi:MAG: hypothetical protein A3A80_02330 [Candidatus Terrybacteria bacterium RIFCSPLOWO2_01_FULL_44_24]|uniref:Uncharacterized protein n=1 Tax=Candidatus Terrybacteria bacterium RIFCSPHIGHO2_01_FULL_43_35 TaxID=1802361 RepID=A0A1G2PEC0_9BACT|nr:MAG: hypothetical protein A2828_02120 [Candidatus Terrybacteria bacterium RIFCSPHIGHO2_01_FULL_43_35]OHA50916.1 MAG: hypothetical protein A3A80_02330 [Candidatus Terrybacteria bacterium RIFCSPLOWO2_01_FULL_44_24]
MHSTSFKKIKFNRGKMAVMLLILVIAGGVLAPQAASAQCFIGVGPIGVDLCDLIGQIIAFILGLILEIFIWFVTLAGALLTFVVVDVNRYMGYFDNDMVRTGWGVVRDLVNMFFAFILVVIAFGTILGLPDYNLRKLMPQFLIAAILVNFSLFLGAMVINFANVIMGFFIANGFGTNKNIGEVLASALRVGDLQINTPSGAQIPGTWLKVANLMFSIVFAAATFFLLLFLAILFVMRIVILWTILIVSPLAMISLVLPRTKGFFQDWMNQLITWSLFGVFGTFFIWLTTWLVSYLNDPDTKIFVAATNYTLTNEAITPLLLVGKNILQFITVFIFLSQGMAISKKMSGQAGGVAAGLVTGLVAAPTIAGARAVRRGVGREIKDRTYGLRSGVAGRIERIPVFGGAISAPLRGGMRADEAAVGEHAEKYRKEASLGPRAVQSIENRLSSMTDRREKAGALIALAEKRPLRGDDFTNSFGYLRKIGKEGSIVGANPALALELLSKDRTSPFYGVDTTDKKSRMVAYEKMMEARPGSYNLAAPANARQIPGNALIEKDAAGNITGASEFAEVLMTRITGNGIGQMVDAGHATPQLIAAIKKLSENEEYLARAYKANAPTFDYLVRNPAIAGAGFDTQLLQSQLNKVGGRIVEAVKAGPVKQLRTPNEAADHLERLTKRQEEENK